MTLCATFAALLHHLTGQDDLVVGFPAACRHHPGLSRLVGCFVNPIPLRIKLDSGESFASLLRSVRRACVEAYEHQDYPFDMLVGDLRLPRDPGRSPLFDVGFTWDDFEGGPDVAGLTFDEYPQEDATVKDDLRLFGGERGGRVWLTIGYSLSLFRRETVSRIAEALRLVIAAALCDDEVVLSDIEIRDEVTPTADEAVTSRYQL
jgi:non-ribosomal peptide synthetase component F